jgi:hypothetical protein
MSTPFTAIRVLDQPQPDAQLTDEQKWKAWHEKGAAHDKLVNRRLRLAAMVVAIVVACAAAARFLLG